MEALTGRWDVESGRHVADMEALTGLGGTRRWGRVRYGVRSDIGDDRHIFADHVVIGNECNTTAAHVVTCDDHHVSADHVVTGDDRHDFAARAGLVDNVVPGDAVRCD